MAVSPPGRCGAGHLNVNGVPVARSGRTGGRRHTWWIVGAIVLVLAAAGVGTWLATRGTSSAAAGIVTTTSVQTVDDGDDPADRGGHRHDRADDDSRPQLRRVRQGDRGRRDADQVVGVGQVLATVDPTTLNATLGPGAGHVGQRPGAAGDRRGRRCLGDPDRPRQRQHRLGAEPGDRGADGGVGRHARLDDRRDGRLGGPDGRPAGDRVVVRLGLRCGVESTGTSSTGSGSSGSGFAGSSGVRLLRRPRPARRRPARWSWSRRAPTS